MALARATQGPAGRTFRNVRFAGIGAVLRTDTRGEFSSALTAQLPALRRYATALTGNPAVADDLVQDCVERALRRAEQIRDARRLGGWLRSILHNLYVDELRRRRSRGIEEDIAALTDDTALSVPARDGAPLNELSAALGTLNFEHRQILLLVGLEGLNYREIADELRVPIGTVMSRLARARERLRHALENGVTREASNTIVLAARRKVER